MPGLTSPSAMPGGSRLLPLCLYLLILCVLFLSVPSQADDTDVVQSEDGSAGVLQSTDRGAVVVQSAADSAVVEHSTDSSAVTAESDAILTGLDITRRVLGGADSERDAWPSTVALVRPGMFALQDRFFCGGTVVADRWVLTAAHCLFNVFGRQDTESAVRVVAGIHDLVDDALIDEVVVTNIIVHPDYDNSLESPPNDIALLELASSLDAPVGQLFAAESEDYTDTIGFIVGWGATRFIDENPSDYPTTQQEAPVPLVSLETCNSPISYGGLIVATQLCAGYPQGEIDTCAGDSGGPLYIIENGQVVQVGITSFGNGCGQENFYGIYTNVSHFIPWLSNYVAVPEQSPELIAAREAAANGGGAGSGSDNDSGRSGGALNILCLLVLGIASLVRQRKGSAAAGPHGRPAWLSCPAVKSLLLACIALFTSACTVPSIGAPTGSMHGSEPTMKETNPMSITHALTLNGDHLRSGVDGMYLGTTHDQLMHQLSQVYWQTPVCKSDKTALRGTGRLFQTVHCTVNAQGPVTLQGRQVRKLELLLLDQQLVRFDIDIADDAIRGVDTDLIKLLNGTYGQESSAVQALHPADPAHAQLWQRANDRIRLYAGQSLQFIDTRIESKLPAINDVVLPFGH